MWGVCEQMIKKQTITNIIINIGLSHLLRDHHIDITAKISKLPLYATKELPNYFSTIPPKINNTFFRWLIMWIVKYWNCVSTTTNLVSSSTRSLLRITKWIKIQLIFFWKDTTHTSNSSLQELARDFIKHVRFKKFLKFLF